VWTPTTSVLELGAAELEDAVEAVLCAQRVGDPVRPARDADDPPRPGLVLERAGRVERLMGATEAPEPDMDDARLRGRSACNDTVPADRAARQPNGRQAHHQSCSVPWASRATGS